MYIRFVTTEVDEDTQVEQGVFSAAYKLRDGGNLPEYEYEQLRDLLRWFDEHLESPFEYKLFRENRQKKSICWFKSAAKKHLEIIYEMISILENHDIQIRKIKSDKIGYILYEDESQAFAQPFADTDL